MFIYRLPQLAVSAKLLCLLMVAVCGVAPIRLYSKSSQKFVGMNANGEVFGYGNWTDDRTELTLLPIGFNQSYIYSEYSRKYLCFTVRWKLVGMNEKRKRQAKEKCEFREEINEMGYSTFSSLTIPSHFLAFNKRGKPARECFNHKHVNMCNFLKRGGQFDIALHTNKMSLGNPSSGNRNRKRRHRHKTRK